MERIDKKTKQLLSWLLSMVMILALLPSGIVLSLPIKAKAAGGIRTVNLVEEGQVEKYIKKGDYIRFGVADTASVNNFNPYWRVLDNEQTNTEEDGMFVLLGDALGDPFSETGGVPFCNDNEYNNYYQESVVRQYCNNLYEGYFTDKEKAVILSTTKSDEAYSVPYLENPTNGMDFEEYPNILNGDKVFCLSAEEANDANYFSEPAYRKTMFRYINGAGYKTYLNKGYWLRSKLSTWNSYAGAIDEDGNIIQKYIQGDYGKLAVRPAMNLNDNFILLVSDYYGGKLSGEVGQDALLEVTPTSTSNWKLTVLDTSQDAFWAACSDYSNGIATIKYYNAYHHNSGAINNYYIAAIIVDSNGNTVYYGRVAPTNSDEGEVKINLNGKLEAGDTLYVYNEQYNGPFQTDTASYLSEIELEETTEELWVGNTLVTKDNKNDVLGDGTVQYDSDTKTLTLNNPQILAYHEMVPGDLSNVSQICYIRDEEDNTPFTVTGSWDNSGDLGFGGVYPDSIFVQGADLVVSGRMILKPVSSSNWGIRTIGGDVNINEAKLDISSYGGIKTSGGSIFVRNSELNISAMEGLVSKYDISVTKSDIDIITNVKPCYAERNITFASSHVKSEMFGAAGAAVNAKGTLTLQDEIIAEPSNGIAYKDTYSSYIKDVDANTVASKVELVTGKPVSPKTYVGMIPSGGTGVLVEWDKVPGVKAYRVFRKISGGSWKKLTDTGDNSFQDKTVVGGNTYIYAVRCLDEVGGTLISSLDNDKLATYDCPVSELVSPKPTATVTANGIKVTWTAVNGSPKYQIYRKLDGGSWKKLAVVGTNTYTDTAGTSGKKYYYSVRCLDSDGTTLLSKFDSNKVADAVFPAKEILSPQPTATVVSTGIKISWVGVTGASKYQVYRKVEGGSWKAIAITTSKNYTDTSGVAGKKYIYAVRCMDANEVVISKFDATKIAEAIFPSQKPVSPKPTLTPNGNKVTIKWKAVNGADSYRIFKKTGTGSWKKLTDTVNTSFVDKNCSAGVEYSYAVRCLDADGNLISSFDSNKVAVISLE